MNDREEIRSIEHEKCTNNKAASEKKEKRGTLYKAKQPDDISTGYQSYGAAGS